LRRVSKDGSEQPKSAVADFGDLRAEVGQARLRVPCIHPSRRPPIEICCCHFDTLGCRSRASPTSVGGLLRMRSELFHTLYDAATHSPFSHGVKYKTDRRPLPRSAMSPIVFHLAAVAADIPLKASFCMPFPVFAM